MNVRLVKTLFLAGFLGVAVGYGGKVVLQRTGVIATPATDLALSDFPNIPLDMKSRMALLLEKRFEPCSAPGTQFVMEHKVVQVGADYKQSFYQRIKNANPWEELDNCHMTAFWVASGKVDYRTMNSPGLMPELLKPYGFRQVDILQPFNGGRAKYDALKPGDVLQFYRVRSPNPGYSYLDCAHTAIYLGKEENRHFVFQKNGLGCGEEYPYMRAELENTILNYLFAPDFSDTAEGNPYFHPEIVVLCRD